MKKGKKYLGKLSFLCGLLFCLLLGFSSTTCYADVTSDYIEYSINTLNDNGNFGSYQNKFNTFLTTISNSPSIISDITSRVNTYLSNNYLTNLNDRNCVVLTCDGRYSDSITLFFTFSNCSYPNNISDLGYLSLFLDNGFYTFGCYGSSNDKIYSFEFQLKMYGVSSSHSKILNVNETIGNRNILGFSTINYNNDLTLYYMSSMACCGVPSARVSYPSTSSDLNYYMILQDGNGNFQISDPEPSGDVTPSGDDGGGGTIDPSGDSGSNIDYTPILGDINNNITSQGQNIVNQISGDTQKIIANQNETNQQITNRLDDINSYDNSFINNIIDDYKRQAESGDFNASSSILALNDAFFNSSDDGDLIIEWDGIQYLGVDLIPKGALNFTQLVESDEQINKIYTYYKLFATASFGIILISAYYNLALSVLGLGSYFAMNTDDEEESTSDLGSSTPQIETTEEYYTRKFKHERNMRYNKRG